MDFESKLQLTCPQYCRLELRSIRSVAFSRGRDPYSTFICNVLQCTHHCLDYKITVFAARKSIQRSSSLVFIKLLMYIPYHLSQRILAIEVAPANQNVQFAFKLININSNVFLLQHRPFNEYFNRIRTL